MNKEFYRNCIIEDRKTRKFLDFSGEEWFNDFIELKDEKKMKDIFFSSWMYKRFDCNEEYKLKFTFSKEILDLLMLINPYILEEFLSFYKNYWFGNNENLNEKQFPTVNLPLIRMMDYFLEKHAFQQFALVIERLEYQYMILWFELTIEKVNKIIEEDINNPDILYIFSRMKEKEFIKFFKKENISVIQNATFDVFDRIFQVTSIPTEYINNEFFFQCFQKFRLIDQICIVELMQEREYSSDIIEKLHKLLNKRKINKTELNFYIDICEMSRTKLEKLMKIIESSSYFSKYDVQNLELWQLLKNKSVDNIDFSHDYYSDIMDLYHKCREYATSSIVQSLYPLNGINQKVTHMENEHFNILARVRTMWEAKSLEETFRVRTFCSFSILTEKNMSHYDDSDGVLYGYYTNVSADLIAHIYPMDSLSKSAAKYEANLTDRMNMLLDIEDLNQATLIKKTYNQLCIRTKTKDGRILLPDCIICIDKVDETSQKRADELGLNILVIHKNEDTIEVNRDIYEHLS